MGTPAPDVTTQPFEAPVAAGTHRTHLAGADFLRAFATLAVIATHAVQWPQQSAGLDHRFWRDIDQLTRFAVPAFVVLSGVVLAYTYGDRQLDGAFIRRRLQRSVLPWLVWAPLYWIFDYYVNDTNGHDPASIATWFATGGGHLYFLLIVPQLYLVFMVWPRRPDLAAGLACGALAVQTALCVWRLYATIPNG